MKLNIIFRTIFTCTSILISAVQAWNNTQHQKLVRRATNEVVSGNNYVIMIRLSGKLITATTDGNVHQWEKLGDDSQVWHFENAGNGNFAIFSEQNRKLAMTVENGNAENGNNLFLSEYKDTPDQHFILHKVDEAYYITAECSKNAALDVFDISYENGANIDLWDYWGGDGQKFFIMSPEEQDIVDSDEPYAAYLFAYFLGNAPEQEQLSYAVSVDGYNFKALNGGKAVWKSSVGTGCLRDPYIFRGQDGFYYLLATDMKSSLGWNSNRNLLSAKSVDLIHWFSVSSLEIANKYPLMNGADRAWAPQAIYDPEKQSYMIYFAARVPGRDDRTIMYYAYSKDMTKLDTNPELLFAPANGNDAIDSDIIFQNNKYYMYYKNETNKRIYLATADHANGPYKEIKQISEGNIGVEGPNIYKLNNSNKWLLMSDAYGNGYYVMQETTDLVNFKTVNRNGYSFNFTPRHGYVIPITASQYNSLLAAYPSNGLTPLAQTYKKKTTTTAPKTTTTIQQAVATNNQQQQQEKHESGYPYCETTTTVVYTDLLFWGVENNDWCVIKKSNPNSNCPCWSEKLGYSCCTYDNTVYYTDGDGKWGFENNNWCGIKSC